MWKTTTKPTLYVVFIELIALLNSAESSILPDSPRSVCVHGGIGPSSVRKHSWQFISNIFWVCFGVHGLDVNPLRSVPDQIFWILPLQLFLSQTGPFRMQLSAVLTDHWSMDQRAVCEGWGDWSSNQVPGSPLCGQHAYCWLNHSHMEKPGGRRGKSCSNQQL